MADIALNFSKKTFSERLTEAQHQTGAKYQAGPVESVYTLAQPFGNLTYRHIRLRDGLALLMSQWHLQEPLRVVSEAQNYAAFELSFCITGQFQGQFERSSTALPASPGRNFSSFAQGDVKSTTEYAAHCPISILTINIDSARFCDILPDCLQDLHLGQSIEVHTTQVKMLGTLGWTTPTMLTAIQQILNCPYEGEIKKLYLESKALELVALKLEQVQQLERTSAPKIRLKSDDITRLYQAKDILLRDIERPPSLTALARQVGMNDFKLKRGFRQVFGTTVFGCLYQYRMEQARQLLETQNLRVVQVAQTVGYANPSQFSAAFKRRFGHSPKDYKRLNRG
ncbi:MAG: AraC family transcriptional regulator [Cyanobacteria bacterium P01_A01_bin.114]